MLYGFNIAIIQIWRKLVKSNSKISVSYNLPGKGAEKTGKFPPKKGLYPSCGGAFGENDGDIAKLPFQIGVANARFFKSFVEMPDKMYKIQGD